MSTLSVWFVAAIRDLAIDHQYHAPQAVNRINLNADDGLARLCTF